MFEKQANLLNSKHGYVALPSGESKTHASDIEDSSAQDNQICRHKLLKAVTVLLVLSNILTGLLLTRERWGVRRTFGHTEEFPSDYARVSSLPTMWTRFEWWTSWGMTTPQNESDESIELLADDLWDQIIPSHGLIAVDRKWAAERHWPESMYLPKDPHGREKGVYLLEGYHLLHCLVSQ